MRFSQEERAKLWLSAAEVTADRWQQLAKENGSAEGVWEAFSENGSELFAGTQKTVLTRMYSPSAMEAYENRLEKLKISVLFDTSEQYPALLKEISDPPYALYYLGDLSVLELPMISVIGTRRPSSYGKEMAKRISIGLGAAGVCVVSGLAYGLDACAHEGALEGNGATVAVLGSGMNVPYPQENIPLLRRIVKQGGLAISEYPLDAKPLAGHFPHRNRIVSGLSAGLVFVEGKVQSGGMITVSAALAQGREIFAVPGQVGNSGSEGPHTIIREGARLVTCAEDILEDLNFSPKTARKNVEPSAFQNLSPGQRMILEALRRESMTIDALTEVTGLSAETLMAELSVMEIMGQIRKESGNLFSIV